jgi:hypothetical protein
MQQGVPILDADWNEMEDLQRYGVETMGKWFIGSGVPAGSDGFRIMESPEDNNFLIGPGIIMVKGKKVINESDNVTYQDQPRSDLTEDLTTPAGDTASLVYLDTWESEVTAEDDGELIDTRIGLETCIRLKREWVVRVVEGSSSADMPSEPDGHAFYPLAVINRTTGSARITFDMITDRRKTHLTLAENTKAPLAIYGPLGTVIYSLENFAQLLELTEEAYFNLLQSDLFMSDTFSAASPLETVMITTVFNEVMQVARTSSVQARIRNIDNTDGLEIMKKLYDSQSRFVSVITGLIAGDLDKANTSRLLEDLDELLEGVSGGDPLGLKVAAFTNENLYQAIRVQEEINREIGNRTQILPHGHLVVLLIDGPAPETIITAGETYRYQFLVRFEATTPAPPMEETFDIRLAMNPPGWNPATVGHPGNTLMLETGEETTLDIDIEIPADSDVPSATLELNVRSQRNPAEMDTTNTEVVLSLGSGGTQPNPLQIDLTSPAINVNEDTLQVGRGGPFGLAGKGVNMTFRFSYTGESTTEENYNVSFTSTPEGSFEEIADIALALGGASGTESEQMIGFQATETAVNGTTGTLTVRIEQISDTDVNFELPVMLEVNKS